MKDGGKGFSLKNRQLSAEARCPGCREYWVCNGKIDNEIVHRGTAFRAVRFSSTGKMPVPQTL